MSAALSRNELCQCVWHAYHQPEDLRCWQLADAVRSEVIAICANKQIAGDFRFCDGFRDAAGSVCRNLAEGFARYESAEIVQFFRYALASLAEVQDYFTECGTRDLIPQPKSPASSIDVNTRERPL